MIKTIAILAFCTLVTACAQPAYVHHAGEFNRNAADFGHDPTGIADVTVCYSSRGSTPAEVLALAKAECGKFGKTARFSKQDYRSCPLSAPVSAHFLCRSDNVDAGTGEKGETPKAGGAHQVNYDGILFSY